MWGYSTNFRWNSYDMAAMIIRFIIYRQWRPKWTVELHLIPYAGFSPPASWLSFWRAAAFSFPSSVASFCQKKGRNPTRHFASPRRVFLVWDRLPKPLPSLSWSECTCSTADHSKELKARSQATCCTALPQAKSTPSTHCKQASGSKILRYARNHRYLHTPAET